MLENYLVEFLGEHIAASLGIMAVIIGTLGASLFMVSRLFAPRKNK